MLRTLSCLVASLAVVATLAASSAGAADSPTKYTLRYKFAPSEVLRWDVTHRGRIRTTVSGTTQTAETLSQSVKTWRIRDVQPDGTATFEHLVESVDMRQRLTGREEMRYNSLTDKEPPLGFETVARSVGVPLSVVTLSPRGEVVSRQRTDKSMVQNDGQVAIPMPEEPIGVGHSWTAPAPIELPQKNGTLKRINAIQKFTLAEVKTGVATIQVATQVLTPIHDPAIEAQIIQSQSTGSVRFDIDAGRVLSQQMDIDKGVVGFSGEASSIHCASQFTEEYRSEPATAARTTAAAK